MSEIKLNSRTHGRMDGSWTDTWPWHKSPAIWAISFLGNAFERRSICLMKHEGITLWNTIIKASKGGLISSKISWALHRRTPYSPNIVFLVRACVRARACVSVRACVRVCVCVCVCVCEEPYHNHRITCTLTNRVNPFPNKPLFLRICITSLLKTLWLKEGLFVTSNSSFPTVFSTLWEKTFVKSKIDLCKHFQFGRVQNLSFGKEFT